MKGESRRTKDTERGTEESERDRVVGQRDGEMEDTSRKEGSERGAETWALAQVGLMINCYQAWKLFGGSMSEC